MEHGGKTEVSELLEKHNVHPNIRFTTWEDYAIMAMVEKGLGIILFGILLSASSAEMNRTVLASFSDFPFAFIGIIVGIVELVMVFKSNKE